MAEDVEVDIIANDRGTPAWKAQVAAVHEYMVELAKADAIQKQNERSARDYDRAVQKVINETMTPQQRYNQKVAELKGFLDANKISQDQYTRAVRMANDEMLKSQKHTGQVAMLRGELLSMALGWGSVSTAIQAATNDINEFIEAQKKANKESGRDQKSLEALERRFRSQAGLNKKQGDAASKSILDIAIDTATTPEAAFGMATALASTGVDADQAQGAALRPMAKLMKAQALDPNKAVGEGEMAEAMSKFLAGTGQAKTGANFEKLAVQIQGLKATPLKVTDLGQLAKQASGIKELGRLSPEDMLANFAFLTQTEQAEDAGTHMREVVRQLATAGGNKKATEQLKKMGLRPEDVDFVGEGFQTVLARVSGGLRKLPESEQALALDTLVEGRNIGAFRKLASGQGEVDKLKVQMGDRVGFEADYQMTSTGRNAADIRAQARDMRSNAARGYYGDEYRAAIANVGKQQGVNQYYVDQQQKMFDSLTAGSAFAKPLPPEIAAVLSNRRSFLGVTQYGGAVDSTAVEKQVEANVGGKDALNELKAIRRELEKRGPNKVEVEVVTAPGVDPTPAPPRPAAQLGAK